MPYSIVLTIKRTIAFVFLSMFLAVSGANAATVCSTGGNGTLDAPVLFFAGAASGTCSTPPIDFVPTEPGFGIAIIGENGPPAENIIFWILLDTAGQDSSESWTIAGYAGASASGGAGTFVPGGNEVIRILDEIPSGSNASATFRNVVTVDGIPYTISIEIISWADNTTDIQWGAITISGGVFGEPEGNAVGAQEVTTAQRQSSANKSAGAAFGRSSNNAQAFITQTQTQDRLLENRNPGSGQAALTGNSSSSSAASSSQLAMAYGQSIKRPGKDVWHSKDILSHYRARHLAERREKEKQALDGLNQLGVTAELAQPETYQSRWDIWSAGGLVDVDSSRTGNTFDGDMMFARSGFDYLVTRSFLIGAFGGYDTANADFSSFNIELDSTATIAGGYFGYRMTSAATALPVDLVLDGQVSHAWLGYDIDDNEALSMGSFDATRFAGSLSITAVVLRSIGERGHLKLLPKLGVTYTNEKQDAYTDSAGNAVAAQSFALGQLSFGASVYYPISRGVEVFGRAEGQWDFEDIGEVITSTGTTYKPDDFGVVIGGGLRANVDDQTTLHFDATSEGLGREDYDQYTVAGRLDFRF